MMSNQNNNQISFQQKQQILDKYLSSSATLKSLIDKENESLQNSHIADIQEFASEKERLISEVEEYKRVLIADREYLKTLPKDTKNQIVTVSENLRKSAEKNNYEVKIALEVNRLVLEAVHTAVMGNQAESEAYSNNGYKKSYNSNVEYTRPIKIDQAI